MLTGCGDEAIVVAIERAAAFAEGECGGEVDGVERPEPGVGEIARVAPNRHADLDQVDVGEKLARTPSRSRIATPRGDDRLDLEQRGRRQACPRRKRRSERAGLTLRYDELDECRRVEVRDAWLD